MCGIAGIVANFEVSGSLYWALYALQNCENLRGTQNPCIRLRAKKVQTQKTSNGNDLVSDLGFLFNKLYIRHNKAKPAIQKMPEKDLLEWYDTTYRLYLTGVLLHDCCNNKELKEKIANLKSTISPVAESEAV